MDIQNAIYANAENTSISAEVDGQPMSIPVAPGNKEYDEIVAQSISVDPYPLASLKEDKKSEVDALLAQKRTAGFTDSAVAKVWSADDDSVGRLRVRLIRYGPDELDAATTRSITGVALTNPLRLTVPSHGIPDGEWGRITGVVGTTEINNRGFKLIVIDANTIDLGGEDGTVHTAYVSGGALRLMCRFKPKNDVMNVMTWGNFSTVVREVAQYAGDLYIASDDHKEAIDALATVAEVNTYDINPNWPATSAN